MVAEAVGGWLAQSLALLADATHMFTDVAALALSIFAARVARRPANPQKTYGYYRVEILAALFNGAAIVAVSLYIFVEAFQRFREPAEVRGNIVLWIAAGGLAVNLIALWILRGGRAQSLNVRGAWLHVFADALGSVGAIVAGMLIWWRGWNWIDPVVSVLIGLLVLHAAWRLLAEAVSVLMEGVPHGIDIDEVRAQMLSVLGVAAVHDLHVWSITSGLNCLSAHVVADDGARHGHVLQSTRATLHDRFGIDHITLQVEGPDHPEPPMHQ